MSKRKWVFTLKSGEWYLKLHDECEIAEFCMYNDLIEKYNFDGQVTYSILGYLRKCNITKALMSSGKPVYVNRNGDYRVQQDNEKDDVFIWSESPDFPKYVKKDCYAPEYMFAI